MTQTIPSTCIAKYYRDLPTSREARLDLAKSLLCDLSALATCYADSVEAFASYRNATDAGFYESRIERIPDPSALTRTLDLALRLAALDGIAIINEGDCNAEGHLPPGVSRVPSDRLGFDYLDREIVPTRTTGNARFDDEKGTSSRAGLRLDLLLVAKDGRVPIIGEVKRKTDKDPFAALIQALACAAHLTTPGQYARLLHHDDRDLLIPLDGQVPPLDLYLILVGYPRDATHISDLFDATRTLSQRLLARTEINTTIRRIACLEIELAGQRLNTTSLFAYERSSAT